MKHVFQGVLDLSLIGSLAILVLLFLRLFPRKYPKWGDVALWGLVGLRLMIPFHIESKFSLVPSSGKTESTFTAMIPEMNLQELPVSDTTNLGIESIIAYVWFAGALLMLIYFAVSYIRIKRRFDAALLLHGNIYQSEFAVTPIVIGYFRPAIYLPFRVEESCVDAIIAHEQTHIRRCDHWWKLLAFLCLSIHWFNPLVWIAYACFGQDVELACDEAVIKQMNRQGRADYAEALLLYSIKGKRSPAAPMAFGSVNPKVRIRAIAQYRRSGKGKLISLVVCAVTLALCFLTNPVTASESAIPEVMEPETQPPEASIHIEPTGKPSSKDMEQDAVRMQIELMEKQLAYLKLRLASAKEQYQSAEKNELIPLRDLITHYEDEIAQLETHIQSAKKQIGIE